MSGETRVPIYIDPNVRDALNRHLYSDRYMGSGVGFSEFIRRALLADDALGVPDRVQPDRRGISDYLVSVNREEST